MHTDISWWFFIFLFQRFNSTVLCRLVKGKCTTPANNSKNKNGGKKSGTNYGMEEKSLEQ